MLVLCNPDQNSLCSLAFKPDAMKLYYFPKFYAAWFMPYFPSSPIFVREVESIV